MQVITGYFTLIYVALLLCDQHVKQTNIITISVS